MESIGVIIGLIGTAIVVIAYALFAAGKLKGDDWRYPALNILGTAGILYSLIYQYNLPSVVMQIIWIALSLVGLVRIVRGKRHG
jgi:hypothetical protein